MACRNGDWLKRRIQQRGFDDDSQSQIQWLIDRKRQLSLLKTWGQKMNSNCPRDSSLVNLYVVRFSYWLPVVRQRAEQLYVRIICYASPNEHLVQHFKASEEFKEYLAPKREHKRSSKLLKRGEKIDYEYRHSIHLILRAEKSRKHF